MRVCHTIGGLPVALCGLSSSSSSLLFHYQHPSLCLIFRRTGSTTCCRRFHRKIVPFNPHHIQHRRQRMEYVDNNSINNGKRGNHHCTAGHRSNYSTATTTADGHVDEFPTINNSTATTDDIFTNDKNEKVEVMDNNPSSRRPPILRFFYNDVYEVILPKKHRFPMKKYRQVRTKVQNLISKLPQEQQERVDCGEF
mmetsp:Transcript_31380/g.36091  ORF Transcript_31380/g.36091 Transcript_31380/m.36091 type:complete len:196 (+) Transcript_31380:43-630(+)